MNVISIILFSFASHALDREGIQLLSLCKQRQNCSTQAKEVFERLKLTCELEIQSQKCAELSKKNPQWAPLMRRCDVESMCRQQYDHLTESGKACLRGYKNALIDLGVSLKNLSVSLADLVENSWEQLRKDGLRQSQFLIECNKTISCKRDLVKEDHRYRNLSDDKLNSYSATFLWKQAQEVKGYQAALEKFKNPQPVNRSGNELFLTEEQKHKLSSLMKVASSKIKTQYQRYACYSPLAQEELKCYAIGTVVDPTMIAGYFVKGGRAAIAISRISKENKAYAIAAKQTVKKFDGRADLISKYLNYSPTTVGENQKWISLADKGVNAKSVFFDIENSQIKNLNDTLKDKNLVTSLTNYHKDLLDTKMQSLQKEFPDLVIDKYSDFKSMRYAFSGQIPPDLEKRLKKIFKETNAEFAEHLKSSKVVRATDPAGEWFRAGVGNSADQANLAARYSRGVSDNSVHTFSQKGLQTAMSKKLSSLEKDRQTLREVFKGTSAVEGQTLHQDVFDIVRKNKGDSKKISEALSGRFALERLPKSSVRTLERYVKNADDFSPGLYIAKREVAHLNEATYGGLSADIIGLGGANLKGTAEALAKTDSVEKALEKTRFAEKSVTLDFIEQKKTFESVVTRSVNPGKLKTICSGDDCVSVATKPLSEGEKQNILNGIANTKYSGGFRLAFVSDGIKDVESRNLLATQGESIEKKLRQTLGTKIEPNKLKGLTFGVDMRTQTLNQGGVKLLVGHAQGVRLTERERDLIDKFFNDAVESLNKELSEGAVKAQYRPIK